MNGSLPVMIPGMIAVVGFGVAVVTTVVALQLRSAARPPAADRAPRPASSPGRGAMPLYPSRNAAVPRPGTLPPANSTTEAITRALRDVSPAMQRRILGFVDDIADAEARGETITRIFVMLAPRPDTADSAARAAVEGIDVAEPA